MFDNASKLLAFYLNNFNTVKVTQIPLKNRVNTRIIRMKKIHGVPTKVLISDQLNSRFHKTEAIVLAVTNNTFASLSIQLIHQD